MDGRNMELLSVFCIGFILNAEVYALQSCQSPAWELWSDSCYFYLSSAHWDVQQSKCEEMGATLVAPRSLKENNFIIGLVQVQNPNKYYLWIGCKVAESTWECENQVSWNVPFWQNLQSAETSADCASTSSNTNGNWFDISCDRNRVAVCVQRDPSQLVSTHPPLNLTCVGPPMEPTCGPRTTRPRRYCFTKDSDGQLLNSCLLDHTIREFVTQSNPSCASACIMDPACLSFNIKINDPGLKICQLNDATRCNYAGQFQSVDVVCNYAQECVDSF